MSSHYSPPQCRRRLLPECLRDFGLRVRSSLASDFTRVGEWTIHERRSAIRRDRPPIIFVHGLAISSLYFIPLAECLSGEFEVRQPDQPGFGRSEGPADAPDVDQMAQWFLEWMDVQGIDRAHLVANSLGCQIAAAIAQAAPHRIMSAVLIGPTADLRSRSIPAQAWRIIWDAPHEPFQLWINHLVDQCRAGCRRIWQMIAHMLEDRIEDRLSDLETPMLFVRGMRDPSSPRRWMRHLCTLAKRGEYVELPGWHCVHYSDPALTAETVLPFLKAHSTRHDLATL